MMTDTEHATPGRIRGIFAAAVLTMGAVSASTAAEAQTLRNLPVVDSTPYLYGVPVSSPPELKLFPIVRCGDGDGLVQHGVAPKCHKRLVRYNKYQEKIEPWLARFWTISDDRLVYSFTLHKGLEFANGTPLTAEAVKFTFERELEPKLLQKFADFLNAINSVEVHDTHLVVFTLNKPYKPFLFDLAHSDWAIVSVPVKLLELNWLRPKTHDLWSSLNEPYALCLFNLADPTGLIVSPAAVEKHGKDFGRNPSGTGAFRFVEWESNAKVVAVRNDEYWGETSPLDALVFRPITDANTHVAEMLSDVIDLMVAVPPDNVATFATHSTYTVHEQAGPHVRFLILNAKEGPFADKCVR